MKRIFFNLAICGFFATTISAQSWIMTEQTHGLNPIEGINEMILTEIVDPGVSGQNVVWDFSDLNFIEEFTGTIENASTFETNGKFNGATIVLKEFSNSFYYKYINSTLEECGIQEGGNTVTEYDVNNPPVKIVFPFGYDDTYSKGFTGTQTTSNNVRSLNGTTAVEGDGFGTLKLPIGTINNVLRVKSTKSYDNVLNDNVTHFDIVTYRWYASDQRYPLLVYINICTNGNCNSLRGAYTKEYTPKSSNKSESSDNKLAENISLEVLPNPVSEILTINYKLEKEEDITIDIFDGTGKKVNTVVNEKQAAGAYSKEVNVKEIQLLPGVHYVRLNINGNSSAKAITKQIVVE